MAKYNFKKIGLLGGSFDPPHKGHLFISNKSFKLFHLDKVIWAITKKNPLKKRMDMNHNNLIENNVESLKV